MLGISGTPLQKNRIFHRGCSNPHSNAGAFKKVENAVNVEKSEDFEGWNNWIEKNKQGLDCIVKLRRERNQVILQTENLGIKINSISTIQDCPKDLYIALTGDQCAITNINLLKA